MKALITIIPSSIGDATVQTVNARDLHAFLNVQTQFKDWIARRIEEYSFEDGKDFCSFLSESSGGRPAKEYALTLDMAKELSMVERNDKGKQYTDGSPIQQVKWADTVLPLLQRQSVA